MEQGMSWREERGTGNDIYVEDGVEQGMPCRKGL
jgi:hypothetical protein